MADWGDEDLTGPTTGPGESVQSSRAKPSGDSLEPLTTEVLLRRSLEISPTNYLTIISIIQGVALALLFFQSQDAIEKGTEPTAAVLLQAAAHLLILVLVFHLYCIVSILFRWPPSFMDAFLPFLLGPFEILPAYYVGQGQNWSRAVALFCSVLSVALFVTTFYTSVHHFGKKAEAKKRFDDILRETAGVALVVAALVLFFGNLAERYGFDREMWAVSAAGSVLGCIIVLVTIVEFRLVAIYREYGITRRMFS